jgi:hypothetical protein
MQRPVASATLGVDAKMRQCRAGSVGVECHGRLLEMNGRIMAMRLKIEMRTVGNWLWEVTSRDSLIPWDFKTKVLRQAWTSH